MDALAPLEPSGDPNLLVGFGTCDDAAVYRISEEVALISTTDFITPPVDDPYWFGQVAAANALSDVYAMGGRPLTALNLLMYPHKKLGMELLREILRGGHEKVREAGASMAGGHSVDDEEPKYGLAVTGVVHPGRILTNCGARPGDALVLTKPLGTGVLFNARRSGKLRDDELLPALRQAAALNGPALQTALAHAEVHACTDVTGFGILGHMLEMARGSGVLLEISHRALPHYPHALSMYRRGETTGSNRTNRQYVEEALEMRTRLTGEEEEILYDPQTSGGLLFAVPAPEAPGLVEKLRASGAPHAAQVALVKEYKKGPSLVVV
jgi:selenide,water dikinase